MDGKTVDDEGRFLALEYDKFWLVHTYVRLSIFSISNVGGGISMANLKKTALE